MLAAALQLAVTSQVVGMAPANCSYPLDPFFARVDVFVYAPGPGSLSIWNSSLFWAQDSSQKQERLDSMYHTRALSSGATFRGPSTDVRVATGGFAYTVDEKGSCTKAPAQIENTACSGGIARFLPTVFASSSDWTVVQQDEFMGYDDIEGVKVAVFGWNATCAPGVVDRMHRVYMGLDSQQPVLEIHGVHLGCSSYPAHAYAKFSALENIGDSFSYMARGGLFAVPEGCPGAAAVVSAAASEQTRADACANQAFDQCGGHRHLGSRCCPKGTSCVSQSPHFSQCLPADAVDAMWARYL